MEETEASVIKKHSRQRKKKPALEEQFNGASIKQVLVDSLTEKEKTCFVCGTKLLPIGTEVIRRELEFVPAKYEVTEYIATMYECLKCKRTEDPCFIKDEGCPPEFIGKSFAMPSLMTDILKNKFVLGLPFYRQKQDLKRLGILMWKINV